MQAERQTWNEHPRRLDNAQALRDLGAVRASLIS